MFHPGPRARSASALAWRICVPLSTTLHARLQMSDLGISKRGDSEALTVGPAADNDRVQTRLLCRFPCRSLGIFDRVELGFQRAQNMTIDNDLPPFSCRVGRPDFKCNVGISTHAREVGTMRWKINDFQPPFHAISCPTLQSSRPANVPCPVGNPDSSSLTFLSMHAHLGQDQRRVRKRPARSRRPDKVGRADPMPAVDTDQSTRAIA